MPATGRWTRADDAAWLAWERRLYEARGSNSGSSDPDDEREMLEENGRRPILGRGWI